MRRRNNNDQVRRQQLVTQLEGAENHGMPPVVIAALQISRSITGTNHCVLFQPIAEEFMLGLSSVLSQSFQERGVLNPQIWEILQTQWVLHDVTIQQLQPLRDKLRWQLGLTHAQVNRIRTCRHVRQTPGCFCNIAGVAVTDLETVPWVVRRMLTLEEVCEHGSPKGLGWDRVKKIGLLAEVVPRGPGMVHNCTCRHANVTKALATLNSTRFHKQLLNPDLALDHINRHASMISKQYQDDKVTNAVAEHLPQVITDAQVSHAHLTKSYFQSTYSRMRAFLYTRWVNRVSRMPYWQQTAIKYMYDKITSTIPIVATTYRRAREVTIAYYRYYRPI